MRISENVPGHPPFRTNMSFQGFLQVKTFKREKGLHVHKLDEEANEAHD